MEHLTGIHIDHFIQLEFDGVVKVVNDVGGVNVCVPENIHDPNSGLNIKAGVHHIDGLTVPGVLAGQGDRRRRLGPQAHRPRRPAAGRDAARGRRTSGLLQSPTRLLPVVEDAAHAIYATDAG